MKWIVMVAAAFLVNCAGSKKTEPSPQVPDPIAASTKPEVSSSQAISDFRRLTCVKGKETRVLEVAKKDLGCALNYTKLGKTSEIASSSKGHKHCDDSQKKVSSKLESAGYKCT